MPMRHRLRRAITDRSNEEKAKRAKKPKTEDQKPTDDDTTQVMSPKFSADPAGIVFDDPDLQARWAKTLKDTKEE